jgi:CheY-like chemotaxis protein
MSGIAASSSPLPRRQASLRLVQDAESTFTKPPESERLSELQRPSIDVAPIQVLVVGAEPGARTRMLAELHDVLPTCTRFLEAERTWEVLARAAASQMVVIIGDLSEMSGRSLVRLLARRQPTLPVLAIGATAQAHAGTASM